MADNDDFLKEALNALHSRGIDYAWEDFFHPDGSFKEDTLWPPEGERRASFPDPTTMSNLILFTLNESLQFSDFENRPDVVEGREALGEHPTPEQVEQWQETWQPAKDEQFRRVQESIISLVSQYPGEMYLLLLSVFSLWSGQLLTLAEKNRNVTKVLRPAADYDDLGLAEEVRRSLLAPMFLHLSVTGMLNHLANSEDGLPEALGIVGTWDPDSGSSTHVYGDLQSFLDAVAKEAQDGDDSPA